MYVAAEASKKHDGEAFAYLDTDRAASSRVWISPDRILGWMRDGWLLIVTASLAGAVVGTVTAQSISPRFTSSTELTIAPSNLQVIPNDLYVTNMQADSQVLDVESKMKMITSRNVLSRVADKFDLTHDREFAGGVPLFDLGALLGRSSIASAEPVDVAGALARRVVVARQERSYAVTLSVWTNDPDKSARLSNSIAATFRDEVVHADAERAEQAAQALTARLDELKSAAMEAEDNKEAFRRTNGLQMGSSGQPFSSEAMERMSARLTDARARLAEAEARNNEVSRAVSLYGVDGGAIQSQTLAGLLANEANMQRQIATLSKSLGARHPALIGAMAESEALGKSIGAETERLRRAARVDVDQAKAALGTISEETRSLRGIVSLDDQAKIKLRSLERDADAKSSLYETFLKRAGEATVRRQIDATDLRIISTAVAPSRPTWPPRPIVLAGAGALLGFLAAVGALTALGYFDAVQNDKAGVSA